MLHAVIMAGGRGERFWPLSRECRPKQFLRLAGKKTMLQETASRMKPLAGPARTWVVTNRLQLAGARKLMPELSPSRLIAEPAGRNTAPCAILAAFLIFREDPEAVMALLPADHLIAPAAAFRRVIRAAASAAVEGRLATIGVKPRYPATGYGYIKRGKELFRRGGAAFFEVEKFFEKPDSVRARRFVKSGRYYWNSGIFVCSAAAFLEAARVNLPEIYNRLRPIGGLSGPRRKRFLERTYPSLPSVSIDYGIMEKVRGALMVPADFTWDDLGSWDAVGQCLPCPGEENRFRGKVLSVKSGGCVAISEGPLIGLVGVKDLVVVATGDAVLVCPRSRSQEVRDLITGMKKKPKLLKFL